MELRRDLDARADVDAADRAARPRRRGRELGVGAGHERQDGQRAGGAHRREHTRKSRGGQSQGEGRVGDAASARVRVEQRRPADDAGRLRAAAGRVPRLLRRRPASRFRGARPDDAVQHRSTVRAAQRRGRRHSARCRQGAGPAQHERLPDARLAPPAGRRSARGLHAVRSTARGRRDAAPRSEHPEHPEHERLGAAVEHRRRDSGHRPPRAGRDRGRAPRLVGSGDGHDRQRHRFHGDARGGAYHRAVGPQAPADDPLHPLHRGRAGSAGLPQVRRSARPGGRLDSGGDRAG